MTQHCLMRLPARGRQWVARGFTLIEVMIVVAIIAILSAVAIPAYSDYVVRGKLVEATNALVSVRAQMEQYYQDNRTYAKLTGITFPCDAANLPKPAKAAFLLTCVPQPAVPARTYTLTATGQTGQDVDGFIYTIDNRDARTSKFPARWGSKKCMTGWQMSKGDKC